MKMIATIWFLSAIVQFALSWWVLKRMRAPIPAAVIANTAMVIPTAGAAAALLDTSATCSVEASLAVALMWIASSVLFTVLLLWSPKPFQVEIFQSNIGSISNFTISSWILIWFIIKAYLIFRYGLEAFRIFDTSGEGILQFNYLESSVDLVVSGIVTGAFVAVTLKAACRKEPTWLIILYGIAMLVFLLMGEAPAGTRRTLVALFILYGCFRTLFVPARRWLVESAVLVAVGVALFAYYPYVRFNFTKPDILVDLLSGESTQSAQALGKILLPDPEPIELGATSVIREGVAKLHSRLTDRQWAGWPLTWGSITGEALYIALPSVLAPEKESKDPDRALADAYDLYPDQPYSSLDLSSSPIVELQADFGILVAIAMSTVLQFLALYLAMVVLILPFTALTKLAGLALMWAIITNTEASLAQVIGSVRQLFLLSLIAETCAFFLGTIRCSFNSAKGATSYRSISPYSRNRR